MKTHLNITIEDTVLAYIRSYAAARQVTVSQIIEDHLRAIAATEAGKQNILEVVDHLAPPTLGNDDDLITDYYQAKADKYGS